MASVQDRLKLKRESCDTWSTREQLCLASSVLKSGDQNWISVSRSLRPFAEKEALRPPDWFSQKSCAIQYAILLENADTPKRKKRESGETTGESIVRRLTQERITELGQILAFQRDEYQQLKNDVNLLKSGNISDEKLKKMWEAIEQEEREAEQKAKAHSAWLAKRQQKNETQPASSTPKKSLETPAESQELQELLPESEEDKKSRGGRSPLLTSLLKSPSPTTQIQNPPSTAQTTSPTIASLLGASTKVQSPQKPATAPPQFHHVVTSILTPSVPERPSAGAPTLSMLLELPSNLSRGNMTLQNPQNQSPIKEPLRPKPSNHVASPIAPNIPVTESMVQIIDHIDDVIGKDKLPEVIDKDEINEIIGDIEELIKEEITKSPKGDPGIIDAITVPSETKIVGDEEAVSSHSSQSEMAIEEIDQSTSSIAEIIGTVIEPELKVIVQAVHPEVPVVEMRKEKVEEKEEVSNVVVEKTESIEMKEEGVEKQEEEEEKNEVIEKDADEEKPVPEEVPELPMTDTKSPLETTLPEPDCKIDKNEERYDGTEGAIVGKEEEEEEEKAEIDGKEEAAEEDEKISEVVPEETPEVSKETLELKSEDTSSVPEEEKPRVKDESGESEEKTTSDEVLEELSPKPEDEQSNDEKPECEENVFDEVEEKSEVKEEASTIEKSPESPKMKEEEAPVAEESPTKSEAPDEIKEEIKIPEESDERMEELKEELPNKNEENSPKDDFDEELDPPVLPNELEDSQVEKKENEEETKPEVQPKESDDDTKPEETPAPDPIEEEQPSDEKTEIEPIPENKEPKLEKEDIKNEELEIKKEEINVNAPEDPEVEEEESSLTKLPPRAMKTYSKKQNAVVDSEPETESDGDYKAWRKSILLHYSRLATHKYASLFLRPITEDHAPGYHSVVFRPMDLSTIKKNIDNGTIRTNMQFQRDVMLMFQNAIMYNKSDSCVYKMAISMQEECLQSMQILVEATGEGAYRRETRTAASSSSETSEGSIIKRKRSHITPSPMILDIDSPRMKKRRKSEND